MKFKPGPQKIMGTQVKEFPDLKRLTGHWVTLDQLGKVTEHDWNLCTKCNRGLVRG